MVDILSTPTDYIKKRYFFKKIDVLPNGVELYDLV